MIKFKKPAIQCLLSMFVAWTALQAVESVNRPPNVVILYGDDVGYGDVGVYGSTMIPTPRIDAFAGEGLRFTDAASAATAMPPPYRQPA